MKYMTMCGYLHNPKKYNDVEMCIRDRCRGIT